MTVPVHTSAEATAADRGVGFGIAQAEAVRTTIASYRRLFAVAGLTPEQIRELGAKVAGQLAEWPDVSAEIAGIAHGAGVDERELFAVNARTEILGGTRPECTVVGVPPQISADGELLLAQNWDWHPDQAASLVVWRIRLAPDRWLVTLTEAGILAKIGMNSRGLAVCLNLLRSDQDHGIGGLPIHVMLRLLLQRCGSLTDALELVQGVRVSASSCITIATTDGAGLVSAEVAPSGTRLVWPDDGRPLVHTNHFLDPGAAGDDRLVRLYPDTLTRHRNTHGALTADSIAAEDVVAALRSHDDGPHSVCCHPVDNARYADREATLASVLMVPGLRRMTVTAGPPCTAEPEVTDP